MNYGQNSNNVYRSDDWIVFKSNTVIYPRAAVCFVSFKYEHADITLPGNEHVCECVWISFLFVCSVLYFGSGRVLTKLNASL